MEKFIQYTGNGVTTLDIKGKGHAFPRGKLVLVTDKEAEIFERRKEFEIFELNIDVKGMPKLKDMIYDEAVMQKHVDERRLAKLQKMSWATLQEFRSEFHIPGEKRYKKREELEKDIIKHWDVRPVKDQKIAVRRRVRR